MTSYDGESVGAMTAVSGDKDDDAAINSRTSRTDLCLSSSGYSLTLA